MYQWLGESPVIIPEGIGETIEPGTHSMEEMLWEFEQVRRAEIDLLPKFDPAAWNSTQKTTVWDEVSLYWLVCKTYQYALDHTKNILALSLFWDRIAARTARESGH
jgi:hypothetical protein